MNFGPDLRVMSAMNNPTSTTEPSMPFRNAFLRGALAAACLVALLGTERAEASAQDAAVKRPITAVIGNVRQKRDLKALEHFHLEEQGRLLLGDAWAKGTDAQRKEFKELFARIFGKIAFPKIRQNLEHLAATPFGALKVEGDRAKVDSVLVIMHPLKKQELKLRYDVVKDKAAWKVVDVAVLGDSMLTGIREDQIEPLLKEGGWDKLLEVMRQKDAELKSVPLTNAK